MGPVGRRPLLAAGLAGLVLVAGCAPPPAISNRVVAAVEAINPFDNQPGKLSATEIRTANMTANRAWALVGDFRGIGIWHPLAAQSARYTQADPRMEGAIRVLPLTTGGTMVDELLEWDGTRKTMRYSGVETVLTGDQVRGHNVSDQQFGRHLVDHLVRGFRRRRRGRRSSDGGGSGIPCGGTR